MQDKIIDTLSFCLYTKDFIIHVQDLEKYARDISNIIEGHRMLLMERFKYTHFYIYHESEFSIEPYAIVEYQGVLYSDCYFNLKKAQGNTGLRITNKLKDVIDMKIEGVNIKNIVRDELKNYFGKGTGTTSSYKLNKPFEFDLVRLNDSLKAITPDTRKLYQLNKNPVGDDININEFTRSLDSKVLPFHRCSIAFDIMHTSINTLSKDFYSMLNLLYFPEREPKYKSVYNQLEKERSEDHSKTATNKRKALIALIDNIMNTQYIKDSINEWKCWNK